MSRQFITFTLQVKFLQLPGQRIAAQAEQFRSLLSLPVCLLQRTIDKHALQFRLGTAEKLRTA